MRFARVAAPGGPSYAVQRLDRWVLIRSPFEALRETGGSLPVEGTALLAPVEPGVVVGMARNGFPEQRAQPPAAFLKSARTVAGPGAEVTVDTALGEAILEGELAIVLGRAAHRLTEENALDAVLGYTIGNDVTATGQTALDPMLTQAKNGLNFTPLGPVIETDVDPFDARITVTLNGETVATASTSQLARNVVEVLVYVSRFVALGPGDVVLTGCPGTGHAIVPGDRFMITIDGIGDLDSTAVEAPVAQD